MEIFPSSGSAGGGKKSSHSAEQTTHTSDMDSKSENRYVHVVHKSGYNFLKLHVHVYTCMYNYTVPVPPYGIILLFFVITLSLFTGYTHVDIMFSIVWMCTGLEEM